MNAPFPQPLLVVGCPRSGTFLLCAFLEANFDIVTPTETHFIPYFQKYLFYWGDLRKKNNRIRLLGAIYEFLEIWIPRNMAGRDPKEAKRLSLLDTRPEFDAIISNSSSYTELIQALFMAYAKLHGKKYSADKSAFFSVVPLRTLESSLPDMRVIHIVRDGRDVCVSWLKTWFPPQNLCQAAHLWAKHVVDKRTWGREHPDQYLEVRYEDFVADPPSALLHLSRFLQMQPVAEPVHLEQTPLAKMLVTGVTHQQLGGKINADNIGKWVDQLSASDAKLMMSIAGKVLGESGYAIEPDTQATWLDKIKIRALTHLFPFFQKMFYLRATKPILPLAIIVCQILGISLSKILNRGNQYAGWR